MIDGQLTKGEFACAAKALKKAIHKVNGLPNQKKLYLRNQELTGSVYGLNDVNPIQPIADI